MNCFQTTQINTKKSETNSLNNGTTMFSIIFAAKHNFSEKLSNNRAPFQHRKATDLIEQ